MPICFECHSYINGLVVIRMDGGLICPVCMTIVADDPSAEIPRPNDKVIGREER